MHPYISFSNHGCPGIVHMTYYISTQILLPLSLASIPLITPCFLISKFFMLLPKVMTPNAVARIHCPSILSQVNAVVLAPSLPRTASNKVMRRMLRTHYGQATTSTRKSNLWWSNNLHDQSLDPLQHDASVFNQNNVLPSNWYLSYRWNWTRVNNAPSNVQHFLVVKVATQVIRFATNEDLWRCNACLVIRHRFVVLEKYFVSLIWVHV